MSIKSKIESIQNRIIELRGEIQTIENSLDIQLVQNLTFSDDFEDHEYNEKNIAYILKEYSNVNKKALSQDDILLFNKAAERLISVSDENALLIQNMRTDIKNKKEEINKLQNKVEKMIQKDQELSDNYILLFSTPIKHLKGHLTLILSLLEKHKVKYSLNDKKIMFNNGLNDSDIRNIIENELREQDKWFNFKSLSSKDSYYIARKEIVDFLYPDES